MNDFEGRMNDLDTDLATLLEKCVGCAVQCELVGKLLALRASKTRMEGLGGNMLGEAGEEFDNSIDAQVPPESAEAVKEAFRKLAGTGIEACAQVTDELEAEIKTNAMFCNGVLKMRASKGPHTYTASICTSPLQYAENGGKAHLPAHVKVEPKRPETA